VAVDDRDNCECAKSVQLRQAPVRMQGGGLCGRERSFVASWCDRHESQYTPAKLTPSFLTKQSPECVQNKGVCGRWPHGRMGGLPQEAFMLALQRCGIGPPSKTADDLLINR
jgi:hypothetical protein